MRASDSDRQRTIDELRRHCAAGRIDVDEFAARIEAVHAAVTMEDLDAIRADLPMMRVAEPGGGGGVWAKAGGRPSTSLVTGDQEVTETATTTARLVALMIAVVSVFLVLAVIGLAFASEWVWALMLFIGWAAGVVQGGAIRRRRRR
jgi:hypothetical protein